MAWRIEESVIRGEIDNRQRGRVVGRIWFTGLIEPVELHLHGNAWRDLAGRKLEFVNPNPRSGSAPTLGLRQTGVIGDCTASRKVKAPDTPIDLSELAKVAGKSQPWHWANCFYLEWFGRANGRVVIESVGYRLTVCPDTGWDMTPAEEETQRAANARALQRFAEQLGRRPAPAERGEDVADDSDLPWDEDPALSERAADRLQEEADRLVDRVMARMESEGEGADYEKILEEELQQRRLERGDPPPTAESQGEPTRRTEERNRRSEEDEDASQRKSDIRLKHRLAERAFAFSSELLRDLELHGGMSAGAAREHPVVAMISSLSIAGAKLAGALNGCLWPPLREECGLRIAGLKRARRHLRDAWRAAEACSEQSLADSAWLTVAHEEIRTLLLESDAVLAELRERLERGFD